MTRTPAKECSECGEVKPLTDFHRHRGRPDGVQSKCKVCRCSNPRKAIHDRRQRELHPERFAERRRRQEERHPEKHRARRAVTKAVERGVLIKPDRCEQCEGKFEKALIHGHHEDYSKPLDVRWLCLDCHVAVHASAGKS